MLHFLESIARVPMEAQHPDWLEEEEIAVTVTPYKDPLVLELCPTDVWSYDYESDPAITALTKIGDSVRFIKL
jgi:hypothetical protein